MKQTNFYVKQLIPLSLLLLCSAAIWFFGPKIQIGGHFPFLQPEKRSYLITFILLAWILKFLFFDLESHLRTASMKLNPELEKKLKILFGRWQGACEFLKRTVIYKEEKTVRLSQLPWHILIGPKESGKTALLANANVNYILAKQLKQKNVTEEYLDNCDWWVTRDLTILDVPGDYLDTNTGKKSHSALLWKNLLSLIRRGRGRHGLSGIIVAIPFAEFLAPSGQQKLREITQNINQRIGDLVNTFNAPLSLTVIITKCDLLAGFLDFFKDSGSDELAQAWGVTLPVPKKGEKPLQIFIQRFNMLIKRINKQLMWRLHQERNASLRPLIKDFPLQLEQLKEMTASFLKNTATAYPQMFIHGIYLTSATQTQKEKTAVPSLTIGNKSSLGESNVQLYKSPNQPAKAYFLKQLLLQGLSSPPRLRSFSVNIWLQRTVYTFSIGLVLIAGFILSHDFKSSIKQTYAIQNKLSQYQISVQQSNDAYEHLIKSVPLLHILEKTSNATTIHGFNVAQLFSFYTYKSTQIANQVYRQTLENIVLPELNNYFAHYLRNPNNKNPEQVYAVLKSYLMLHDLSYRQSNFVVNTFKRIAVNKETEQSKQLLAHIAHAIEFATFPQTINQDLVEQTRKLFSGLSNVELGSVILTNTDSNNIDFQINLGTQKDGQPTFVTRGVTAQIPSMYTADAFSNILSRQINQAAEETLQGNWVLGEERKNKQNLSLASTLSEQLRTAYITHYVDLWESLLSNTHLYKPKNFDQTNNLIENLISNQSPLLVLLKTLNQNTQFAPILATSPKIQNLDALLTTSNEKTDGLYPIFVGLASLQKYLHTIEAAPDKQQAAFVATVQRMQSHNPLTDPISQLRAIAETNPEPIKTWLQEIADTAWFFLLQETGHYIDVVWKDDVYSVYQTQIANRYPLNSNGGEEIDLVQFTNFFGEPGIVSHFYRTYLQTFVNTSEKKWQWLKVDNQNLPLSEDTLNQIQHAFRIQHAFFPNGDNKLYVPFTLQPVILGKNLKDFQLTMNGQQIQYNKNSLVTPHSFAWPGNNPSGMTTLHWVTTMNQIADKTVDGDWGWFKLINQSTQANVSNKQLLLSFTSGTASTKYLLTVPGQFNPFILSNLQQFYLPSQILEQQKA